MAIKRFIHFAQKEGKTFIIPICGNFTVKRDSGTIYPDEVTCPSCKRMMNDRANNKIGVPLWRIRTKFPIKDIKGKMR